MLGEGFRNAILTGVFMDGFDIQAIRGLYRKVTNTRHIAGHIGFFSSQGHKGWTFHTWNQGPVGWAMHRTWNFGLFCVHHYGPGKSTQNEGWHLSFAFIKFKKQYKQLDIKWGWANKYHPDTFLGKQYEKQKTEGT